MKNPLNQFRASARKTHLSDEAAQRIRERLIAHMHAHPLPARPIKSPYQRFIGVFSPLVSSTRALVVTFSFLLLVVAGGGATYAAEGALPGDLLYPFKVSVIEPLTGFLAVSPSAKAAWRVALVETRVNEIERLATKAQLTPEEGARSQVRFDRSLQAAHLALEKLARANPEKAAEMNAAFATSLNIQKDALNTAADVSASSTSAVEAHAFANHITLEADLTPFVPSITTSAEVLLRSKPDSTTRQNSTFEKKQTEKILPSDKTTLPEASSTSSLFFATSTPSRNEALRTTSTTSTATSGTQHNSENNLKGTVTNILQGIGNEFGF